MKILLMIGAINGFLAVALGAFGAHGLEGKIPAKYIETWKTGVTYQMFHTTAIMIIALIAGKFPNTPSLTWAGWFMLIGIILFSGSLYVLSVTQVKVLGAITPLGGVAFLIGWVLLGYAVMKHM
ncbi:MULTISPECIES: DUF423 domain-containing protein [Bacillaceae]|uniref:DUF423 domain-containing protein n=1 Tax=Bacillaceae TaxID=186817 RepID=UPI001BDEAAC7|nr:MULTISPECIES: DUF423 domain-containing protein [Bacillaceae]MDX8361016.1 DUF423 domain-containing protein [Cytobacillus sp. IB215316]